MSYQANRDHIDLLIRKRDRLAAAAEDAIDALCMSISREPVTPVEAAELLVWARTLNTPNTIRRVVDATGYNPSHVAQWARCGAPDSIDQGVYSGEFPVGWAHLPSPGVPCVYVLFSGSEAVYIGRSEKVKNRLRNHWATKKHLNLTRWWLMVCRDRGHMVEMEAQLIREHQPMANVVGK